MTKAQSVTAVALTWYYRGDYKRILEIMTDSDTFPETYDKWVRTAEAAEKHAKKSGRYVIRAMIDPDAFVSWCRARNMEADGQARTAYANDQASRAGQAGH
jgi:hypothetical protein